MIGFFYTLTHIIQSPEFLLTVVVLSFSVKLYFLCLLIKHGIQSHTSQKSIFFLIATIACSMFGDIAWSAKILRTLFFPTYSYAPITFLIRIAWCFLVLQYQSLALFIQSLTEKKFSLNNIQKLLLLISTACSIYFLYVAFFDISLLNEVDREFAKKLTLEMPLEIRIMRYVVFYLLYLLVLPGLFITFKHMRKKKLPKILKKQLRTFILYLICPYIIAEFLQAGFFLFQGLQNNLFPTVSISTLLLTYAIYYCIKKVMRLRFLDFTNHVQSTPNIYFIDDFKEVLEQLSYASNIHELVHITQTFFKENFNIPIRQTNLYIQEHDGISHHNAITHETTKINSTIEQFILEHPKMDSLIKNEKILIYDEVAYSNFYEETEASKTAFTFLETLNADIFVPLYAHNKLIAYIVIMHGSRQNECFSNVERDEILVFTSYLGNIINLLQNRNIDILIQKQKELTQELFFKNQENNQYKESIRSFLRYNKHKSIGVICYKNRRFIYGNQSAKELINIDLNVQAGHALTKTLKQIAQQVEIYKSPQTRYTYNCDGNPIIISAVPHLEQNMVIVTVSSPDISDIITIQLEKLKDPNKRDYLLYLEKTKPGQLINQLIPGNGEALLNFKIDLLEIGLNNKTTLLDVHDDDLQSVVKILHHISDYETLHILDLENIELRTNLAAKLFGSNPLYNNIEKRPILEKLNGSGTLFIKNIHLLDKESQEYLEEFLTYGYFRIFKSDQRIQSNVRIICNAGPHFGNLAQEGMFSLELYHLLKKNTISMPQIHTLLDEELFELIDGYVQQAIKTQEFKNLLTLTLKDKQYLSYKRPASLYELKTKIQHILTKNSRKNHLEESTEFDPAYSVIDPELIQASRLGKQSLKDQKIMNLLWNKFKNQNKIANFLGVNRSSVNRRCKEYGLD